MTKLILAPFDPAAPGSFRQRNELLEQLAALVEAQQEDNLPAAVRAQQHIKTALMPRLRTDDGTPVADALAEISANDYDALTQGLFAVAGADTVPLASTPTSTA